MTEPTPSLLDRAQALLEARSLRRPPETLPPLAQRCLAWWTAVHGDPREDTRGLRALQREFKALAFECAPGRTARWAKEQSVEAEALFRAFLAQVPEGPAPALPTVGAHLREEARPVLLSWLWLHLDYHVAALSIGLMDSGLLARDPEDPAYAGQAPIREKAVSTVGTLLGLASYLSAPTGREMPVGHGLITVSALLDVLGGALEEAFALGGPRARTLMETGGWLRPAYPYKAADLEALAARQARDGAGEDA